MSSTSEANKGLNNEWLSAFLGNKKRSDGDDDDMMTKKEPRKTPVFTTGVSARTMTRQRHHRWDRDSGCPIHGFSLVICRHPVTKLWLAVNETKGKGWWLPGGFVECGDDYFITAIKETQEEAGIDVTPKGILRVENTMTTSGGRQRVIYYAEPSDPDQKPKDIEDRESLGAAWMSTNELRAKSEIPPPSGLRGTELLDWASYIEGGGVIYPLDIFTAEDTPVPKP